MNRGLTATQKEMDIINSNKINILVLCWACSFAHVYDKMKDSSKLQVWTEFYQSEGNTTENGLLKFSLDYEYDCYVHLHLSLTVRLITLKFTKNQIENM